MGSGSSIIQKADDGVDAVLQACKEAKDGPLLLLKLTGAPKARVLPRGPESTKHTAPSPVGALVPHAWLCMPYKGDVEVQVALNIVDVKQTTHAFRAVSFGDHKDVTAAETVKVEGLAAPDGDGWGVVKTFQTGDLTGARTKYKVHARLASVEAVLAPRKLFLVRHAESTWNRATRIGDVATMLSDVDHGLTKLGVTQCAELQRHVAATPRTEAERAFLAAKKVFSSPSRRTVQTALLALKGHPALVDGSVVLRADLREVRTAHGRDNIARASGVAIRTQAVAGLEKGEYPAVDADAVHHAWWASAAENEATVRRRVDRELAQLCLRSDASAIMNSHSKFIRCMFRAELPDCAFARGKIANCGVVAVDVLIDKPPGRRLEAPELLFGGTFSSADSRASLLEAIRRRSRSGDVAGG